MASALSAGNAAVGLGDELDSAAANKKGVDDDDDALADRARSRKDVVALLLAAEEPTPEADETNATDEVPTKNAGMRKVGCGGDANPPSALL